MTQEVLLGLVFTHVGHLSLNPEGDRTQSGWLGAVHWENKKREDLFEPKPFENDPSVRQDVNKTKTSQCCNVILECRILKVD